MMCINNSEVALEMLWRLSPGSEEVMTAMLCAAITDSPRHPSLTAEMLMMGANPNDTLRAEEVYLPPEEPRILAIVLRMSSSPLWHPVSTAVLSKNAAAIKLLVASPSSP